MRRFSNMIMFSLIVSWAWGQAGASLHFDKPYYLTGEYIFYSTCSSDLPTTATSARVELWGANRTVANYYIVFSKGCASGYFKLPFDLPSSIYDLKIEVFEKKTFASIQLIWAQIPIYNDEDLDRFEVIASPAKPIAQSSANILIEEDSSEANELITCTVNLPKEKRGQVKRISVSVRDYELYKSQFKSTRHGPPIDEGGELLNGIPFLGTRMVSKQTNVENNLLFAFNANEMIFDGTVVDLNKDAFNLELTPFYEKRQINFLDYRESDIQVEELPKNSMPSSLIEPLVDSNVIQHLRVYREEKQINRAFKQNAFLLQIDSLALSPSTLKPDYLVDVQDFEIRGTTVNLFKEILTTMKFRSIGKGNHEAKIFYERNNIVKAYSRAPLFVVNDGVTRNSTFIATLPLQEIGYFSIYSEYDLLKQLSPVALGGVVYVDMLDPNYALPEEQALPKISVQGMQMPLQYPVLPNFKERVPTLGSLLYWDPDVNFSDGQCRFDFRKNDVISKYVVEVVLHPNDDDHVEILHFVRED